MPRAAIKAIEKKESKAMRFTFSAVFLQEAKLVWIEIWEWTYGSVFVCNLLTSAKDIKYECLDGLC